MAASESNVAQLRSGGAVGTNPYVQQPQTANWNSPYWTTIQQVQDPEAGRLRFALELIADGGLTKEAIEKVAKKALHREAKK